MKTRHLKAWLEKLLSAMIILAMWHFPALSAGYAKPQMLTATEELHGLLGRPDVRIVDVRSGEAYEKGHIPGAVHLGADDVIDRNSPVQGVLLPVEKLITMLETRGIGRSTQLILYDDRGGFHAARLFWMFEYFGHRKVAILNGGFPKWQRENRPITADRSNFARGRFSPALMPRRVATADWLLDRRADASLVVIDVRPSKMYRAGHIPWARNIPWSANLQQDGTLKAADDLLSHFAAKGVTPDKNIVVHCQNGKAAAHSYFALRLLGYPRIRSYDRSWAEWGTADDLPKATGTRG